MQKTNNIIHCDLCNSENHSLLFKKDGYNILRCDNCELVFTQQSISFSGESIYTENYFQGRIKDGYADYKSSEEVLKKQFKKIFQQIEKEVNYKFGKLLEVGCAYGYFLDIASQKFKTLGIEISKYATDLCKERNLNVLCGSISSDILKDKDGFDVIVMLDVIEHLNSPSDTLDILCGKLENDGIIYIQTGDIDSLLSKVMRKRWRLLTPPQHLYFFSKKTLIKLLKSKGLNIISIKRDSKIVPVGLILYQLFRRSAIKIPQSSILNKIGLRVNLFDTMTVIAKKEK